VGIGALFLDRADALVPHAHYLLTGARRTDAAKPKETLPVTDQRLAGVVLFILAITLHNIPEGLAVGVGFGAARKSGTARKRAVVDGCDRSPKYYS